MASDQLNILHIRERYDSPFSGESIDTMYMDALAFYAKICRCDCIVVGQIPWLVSPKQASTILYNSIPNIGVYGSNKAQSYMS